MSRYVKINASGKYQRYPGFTFICKLKNTKLWTIFHNVLLESPVFLKYYAPLPISSYHMTVKNFITAHDGGESWFDSVIINMKKYTEMAEKCNNFEYCPKVRMTILYFRRTFGIFLDPGDKEKLLELRKMLVESGSHPEPNFQYHMTFAYAYRQPIEPSDTEAFTKECQRIYETLNGLFKNVNYEIELEKCEMCYFTDMTTYVPLL